MHCTTPNSAKKCLRGRVCLHDEDNDKIVVICTIETVTIRPSNLLDFYPYKIKVSPECALTPTILIITIIIITVILIEYHVTWPSVALLYVCIEVKPVVLREQAN